MRIAFATDHGGFELRKTILDTIRRCGHEALDLGPTEYLAADDYPDYAVSVAQAIQSGQAERGILVCGSGVGVTMAANRFAGVRACLCHDTYSAGQGVEHDAMNVLCLGGRIVGPALAGALVEAFLGARFDGAERFQRRLDKVTALECRP